MSSQGFIFRVLKTLFIDIIWEIIYFPVWWYTQGLTSTFLFSVNKIKTEWNNLSLNIHFKFLFKPMYAQHDFSGRLISFLMRLVQLVIKFIIFLGLSIIYLLLFIFWVSLPFIIIWQIFFNLETLKDQWIF